MNKMKGFTLVEILIVVAIIALLASIAIPSYQSSVRKTRRADAKEALLSAAATQEKIFLQKNAYTADIAELGGSSSTKGFYSVSVTQADNSTNTYLLTATATGVQASDTDCASMTVSHTGLQQAFAADKSVASNCW